MISGVLKARQWLRGRDSLCQPFEPTTHIIRSWPTMTSRSQDPVSRRPERATREQQSLSSEQAPVPVAHLLVTPVREVQLHTDSPKLPLHRNFAWTLAGNITYSGCQWLAIVVIARLCTPEKVGQFALGAAVSAPILSCFSLQLRAVQATDAKNVYEFGDFLGLRALGTSMAMLCIIAVALFEPWSFQSRAIVIIFGLRAGVESFSDIVYGYFQKQERLDMIAKAMILRATVAVFVLAGTLWISRSLILALLLMTGTWLAGFLLYESPAAMRSLRRTGGPTEWRLCLPLLFQRTKPLIRHSAPLAIVIFLLSSSQSISRLFLENYSGERVLGFFSAIATLSGGVGLVYMALGQAAMPTLSKMYSNNFPHFATLLAKLLSITAVSGLVIIALIHIFGTRILGTAYGSAYAGYGGLLTGLTVVAVMNNISALLGVAATASGHYWHQLTVSALIFAASIISGFCLIARLGPSGAMYSLMIIALVQLTGYGLLCARIVAKKNASLANAT